MAGNKRERAPGVWQLTVTLGSDYRGQPRRFYKTVRGTEKEAERELALFYADCIRGNTAPGTEQTVEQMVRGYIEERPRGSLKENTLKGYRNILKYRISPYIGDLRLTRATPRTLQGWVDDLSEQYHPKSVRNAVGLLSASFERLIRFGEMDKNPCSALRMPKNPKPEAKFYTSEETALFLSALQALPREHIVDKVAFELALLCGLRRGEILGLDREDVDLTNYTITVRQTRYEGNKGLKRVDTPKTDKSRRTLSFPKPMRSDFVTLFGFYSERKLMLGADWYDSPAVIRGVHGRPLSGADLLEHLYRFEDEAGLKRVTLHQLRHTNVSAMISLGLDIKVIQERGGWSNASTPMEIYGHLFKEQDEQVASDILTTMSANNPANK